MKYVCFILINYVSSFSWFVQLFACVCLLVVKRDWFSTLFSYVPCCEIISLMMNERKIFLQLHRQPWTTSLKRKSHETDQRFVIMRVNSGFDAMIGLLYSITRGCFLTILRFYLYSLSSLYLSYSYSNSSNFQTLIKRLL